MYCGLAARGRRTRKGDESVGGWNIGEHRGLVVCERDVVFVCMYVYVCVCMYVCMCVYVYGCIYSECLYVRIDGLFVYMISYVCMYVCAVCDIMKVKDRIHLVLSSG